MTKIGLYFGSFNPIHIGHIAIAGYMAEFTDIDQVWFVVSPQNPLKKKETLLEDYERLKMVDMAINDSFKLRSCDVEFRMPKPSYTIDTITYLREQYPSYQFSLIMGEDNLYTFYKWKNAELLATKYSFYVYPRNREKNVPTVLPKMETVKTDIHIVEAPLMEVSGSFIRAGIKAGKDMSYYLTPQVWKYIDDNQYYK